MNIYLAARYSRRLELCGYREELRAMGHVVTSRWLDGTHQIADDGRPIGDDGEGLIEGDSGAHSAEAVALRERFASEDIIDVQNSDCVISFTEPPRTNARRGGRHVEFGIAIGINITQARPRDRLALIVVGHRENVFHWISPVDFAADWAACKGMLK